MQLKTQDLDLYLRNMEGLLSGSSLLKRHFRFLRERPLKASVVVWTVGVTFSL